MADYLVYWKHYWDDVNEYGPMVVDELWHTDQEDIFNQFEPGNNLWVVVTAGSDSQEWRLLQRIHIKSLVVDPPEIASSYGRCRVVGDKGFGAHYDVGAQRDLAPNLRRLSFASGTRINSTGRLIGRTLQRIRRLAPADVHFLEQHAANLKRDP